MPAETLTPTTTCSAEVGGSTWQPDERHRPVDPILPERAPPTSTIGPATYRPGRPALGTARQPGYARHGLPERVVSALQLAATGGSECAAPSISSDESLTDDQAVRDLRALLRSGLLEQRGQTRVGTTSPRPRCVSTPPRPTPHRRSSTRNRPSPGQGWRFHVPLTGCSRAAHPPRPAVEGQHRSGRRLGVKQQRFLGRDPPSAPRCRMSSISRLFVRHLDAGSVVPFQNRGFSSTRTDQLCPGRRRPAAGSSGPGP